MQWIIYIRRTLAILFVLIFSACGSNSLQRDDNATIKPSETVKLGEPMADEKEKISANQKIFIIGDSTVSNPTEIGVGWGDVIGRYMVDSKNLYNLAQSGSSSKSYKLPNDDDWYNNFPKTKQIISSTDISDGGYLLIQFGHNDETDEADEIAMKTYPGVDNSFYNELKKYVTYARDIGLTPVLITPVERMEKVSGYELNHTHIKAEGDYAQTVRDLAEDEDVLLLDLQDKSWQEFNQYKDKSELIEHFGYQDNTHFDADGADIVASWVKDLICTSGDITLCKQFLQ